MVEPVKKEWHSRNNHAYIVQDAVTNTVMLGAKLSTLAQYLNDEYARNQFERVSARGLYEAADKHGGYTGGYHKMRYLVSRCELGNSHIAFENARTAGAHTAKVVTEQMVAR